MPPLIRQTFTLMLLLVVLAATGISLQAAEGLSDQPVVRQKAAEYLSNRARAFLTERDAQNARVWVFFTDKGITDQQQFEAKAATVVLSERALHRRAKMGLDKVVFVDLPVSNDYVKQITNMGGKFRRASRWLNAASFDIPMDKLDAVGNLPFVVRLKPVAGFGGSRDNTIMDTKEEPAPKQPLTPSDLNYDLSEPQLSQINVPAAHAAGYTGAGVTLAIMDTGFRKSHQAFAEHISAGRVLAEWDFVNDDGNTGYDSGDISTQWDHGTAIWSTVAGEYDGRIYGPGYQANIILCKTEDVGDETPVEEDNWVAALEFADSIGTDVITTSLGYSDWYTYEDMDGHTATITIAANTCDGLGIVLCNSMGNDGPASGTLSAPADAYDILSVGAVSNNGSIASFSSRGPTYDGRTKPEVCAQGVTTRCASYTSDSAYGYKSGTSLSTPLVAGVVCLVLQAHPDYTPARIREVMTATADRAANPDNIYGHGIIDAMAAIEYSSTCCTGETVGNMDCIPGQVDMGDLTVLIDHLFISLDPLCCVDEGDVDLSGQPSPEPIDVTMGDLTVLIDHLFISLTPLPACQ